MGSPRSSRDLPIALLSLLGLVSLAVAVFEFLNPANGIHGSEGVVLVIISTALLLLAAVLLWLRVLHGWVAGLFEVLIVLDFLGTGAAAYFLESWVLLALMVIGFVVWLTHILRPSRSASLATG